MIEACSDWVGEALSSLTFDEAKALLMTDWSLKPTHIFVHPEFYEAMLREEDRWDATARVESRLRKGPNTAQERRWLRRLARNLAHSDDAVQRALRALPRVPPEV